MVRFALIHWRERQTPPPFETPEVIDLEGPVPVPEAVEVEELPEEVPPISVITAQIIHACAVREDAVIDTPLVVTGDVNVGHRARVGSSIRATGRVLVGPDAQVAHVHAGKSIHLAGGSQAGTIDCDCAIVLQPHARAEHVRARGVTWQEAPARPRAVGVAVDPILSSLSDAARR